MPGISHHLANLFCVSSIGLPGTLTNRVSVATVQRLPGPFQWIWQCRGFCAGSALAGSGAGPGVHVFIAPTASHVCSILSAEVCLFGCTAPCCARTVLVCARACIPASLPMCLRACASAGLDACSSVRTRVRVRQPACMRACLHSCRLARLYACASECSCLPARVHACVPARPRSCVWQCACATTVQCYEHAWVTEFVYSCSRTAAFHIFLRCALSISLSLSLHIYICVHAALDIA